ncbi:5-oxoprolinase subunit PxpA, partial [Lysobacter sp. 2RAB21]
MLARIDFNCDIGEGCGDDAAIVPYVSSANIACGGHAGDEATMRATLRLCRQHGVAAGAHPGYDDPEHFGRRTLPLSRDEIAMLMLSQLARLASIADDEGVRLTHVKPHGALYNLAADDRIVAQAIVGAVAAFDPHLIVYGLAQSQLTDAAEQAGLRA